MSRPKEVQPSPIISEKISFFRSKKPVLSSTQEPTLSKQEKKIKHKLKFNPPQYWFKKKGKEIDDEGYSSDEEIDEKFIEKQTIRGKTFGKDYEWGDVLKNWHKKRWGNKQSKEKKEKSEQEPTASISKEVQEVKIFQHDESSSSQKFTKKPSPTTLQAIKIEQQNKLNPLSFASAGKLLLEQQEKKFSESTPNPPPVPPNNDYKDKLIKQLKQLKQKKHPRLTAPEIQKPKRLSAIPEEELEISPNKQEPEIDERIEQIIYQSQSQPALTKEPRKTQSTTPENEENFTKDQQSSQEELNKDWAEYAKSWNNNKLRTREPDWKENEQGHKPTPQERKYIWETSFAALAYSLWTDLQYQIWWFEQNKNILTHQEDKALQKLEEHLKWEEEELERRKQQQQISPQDSSS